MKAILIFILFHLSFQLAAQPADGVADSLRQKISKVEAKEDIDALVIDAIKLLYNTPRQAYTLTREIIRLSVTLDHKVAIAKCNDILGIYHQNQGEYDSAHYYYNQSLEIRKELNNPKLLAESLNNFGVLSRRRGQFDSALVYYFKALDVALQLNDSLLLGNYYNNIGLVYENQGKYPEAIDFHTRSLSIREKQNSKAAVASSLNNIGTVYQKIKDYPRSAEYLEKSLDLKKELGSKRLLSSAYINLGDSYYLLKNYDKALSYQEEALKIVSELNDQQSAAAVYDNLAHIWNVKGNIALALKYAEKGLDIRKDLNNISEIIVSSNNLSALLLKTGLKEKAKKIAQQSYQLAISTGDKENVKFAAQSLANVAESMNDFKTAYLYHKIYVEKNDSLLSELNLKNIAEIREKYEAEKNEEKIKLQEAQLDQQAFVVRQRSVQRNLLIALIALFGLVMVLLVRNYSFRIRAEKLELRKNRELDEMRSRFFTNISHEFRTPLALIRGQADELLEQAGSPQARKALVSIRQNSSKALGLVNQLLDLSQIDAGKLKLQLYKLKVTSFLRMQVEVFRSAASQKHIELVATYPEEDIVLCLDPSFLEKIVSNLLSNAINYSRRGTVTFEASMDKSNLVLSVTDTGIGISREDLTKIFNRFFRVSPDGYGTGVGLSLIKELVTLHKGKISVDSEVSVGTQFKVELPGAELSYPEASRPIPDFESDEEPSYPQTEVYEEEEEEIANTGEDRPALLIIEDNEELRQYLGRNLRHEYNVLLASAGDEGLEKSYRLVPDIVISDWMMPGMSGQEVCRQLKASEITSHIPVLLLTAKADSDSRIEGLGVGADDYITKPFDMREIKARLSNLIEQRKMLRKKFSQSFHGEYKAVTVSSLDDLFMKRLYEIVDVNISNAQMNVEWISREMGVSRTQLHRKVTALTGQSPGDILREYRLNRAADLLRQNAGNVSEIAYRVGFENLSYFSKVFKNKYKATPSDFVTAHLIK
jgi:signal transduction histidine kinase/DNA-binding response OmpR family regulator